MENIAWVGNKTAFNRKFRRKDGLCKDSYYEDTNTSQRYICVYGLDRARGWRFAEVVLGDFPQAEADHYHKIYEFIKEHYISRIKPLTDEELIAKSKSVAYRLENTNGVLAGDCLQVLEQQREHIFSLGMKVKILEEKAKVDISLAKEETVKEIIALIKQSVTLYGSEDISKSVNANFCKAIADRYGVEVDE